MDSVAQHTVRALSCAPEHSPPPFGSVVPPHVLSSHHDHSLRHSPPAAYRTPMEAIQNAAVAAALYLEGAIALDCPLVHIAPASHMAKVRPAGLRGAGPGRIEVQVGG